MMTRRDFLASLAALALAPPEAPRVIRIGLAASDEAALRGAQLGAEEAVRTAELLGARFELVRTLDGVAAVVGEGHEEGLEVPLLATRTAGEPPFRRHVFHVASGPAERRDALVRWGKEGEKVVDWHPSLTRFGAEQLNQRFEARFGSPMDELAWAGWVAVKAAAEAALRNPEGDLVAALERLRFDGHKGERLGFRRDHRLRQPLYVVAGDQVLGQVAPEEGE